MKIRAFLAATITVMTLAGLSVGNGSATPANAQAACLSGPDMRKAISAEHAVQPDIALRNARAAAPGDVVRMRLCKDDQDLVYLVTTVMKDGRVHRVTVEAKSGKVTVVR
ncbi:MAG: PepSY domain-containing protein [Bosea sp. (in: a-proteobacteria)]